MSILSGIKSIFTGSFIKDVGKAIDDNVTSDEERLTLRNALETIFTERQQEMNRHVEAVESEITDRHKADMLSDSWLSKNIRPLVLITLTASMIFLTWFTTFVEMSNTQKEVLENWIDLYESILMMAYAFYFTGRSLEKRGKK